MRAFVSFAPVAVVAVALLEVGDVAIGVRQRGVAAGRGYEAKSDEVVARELMRILHGEIGHDRHPVILDQAEADRALLLGVVEKERTKQKRPMRRDARRTVPAYERKILFALCEIRSGEDLTVVVQPLDPMRAVHALALIVPREGVGAAGPVERVLDVMQRKPVGEELHVQQHDVDVVEEVEIDVRDIVRAWYIARCRGESDPRNIIAAKHPHRRANRLDPLSAAAPLSVQEALYIGQKGDKLAVVPLFEEAVFPREFVHDLVPRVVRPALLEQLPVFLDLRAAPERDELQGPQENLAKMANRLFGKVHLRSPGAGQKRMMP